MVASKLPGLPPDAGAARDSALLSLILSGHFDTPKWAPVHSSTPGHTATFFIMTDALAINGVRINVSAILEQQIADSIGACLLTPKLADLLYAQRSVSVLPQIGEITSTTEGMIARSAEVDSAIAATTPHPSGIIQTVGKHWVVSNALLQYPGGTKGENYGWHFPGSSIGGSSFESSVSPPQRVIQGQGWAHPPQHTDASQTCVLVANHCLIDGKSTTVQAVLSDPALAPLASHEGVVTALRQPGVTLLPLNRTAQRQARTPQPGVHGLLQKAPKASFFLTGASIGGILMGPVGVAGGATIGWLIDRWRA